MSIVQQCIVNEEVGASTGALWGRIWQPPMCLKDGSPEQIKKYLVPRLQGRPEDRVLYVGTGCRDPDAGGVRTNAVLDGKPLCHQR